MMPATVAFSTLALNATFQDPTLGNDVLIVIATALTNATVDGAPMNAWDLATGKSYMYPSTYQVIPTTSTYNV